MLTPLSFRRGDAGRLAAPLALVAVALIWGSSHLVVKVTLGGLSVPTLLALRFSVAALPLVRVPTTRAARNSGLGLGVLAFAMYAAHNHGVGAGASPDRAAFVMGASALLVPFLGWWAGERPAPGAVGAAALGLGGLGVMLRPGLLHGGAGDGWVLLAAVLFAVYVRRLGCASPRHPGLSLVAAQLWVMAGLAWVWALPHVGELARLSPGAVWGALYLGVFANLTVMALQGFALRSVAPGRRCGCCWSRCSPPCSPGCSPARPRPPICSWAVDWCCSPWGWGWRKEGCGRPARRDASGRERVPRGLAPGLPHARAPAPPFPLPQGVRPCSNP